MTRVAVVGAGVGGLAAAIRLAVAGHQVSIYERRDEIGGKLARVSADGFTFDVGPSLLTLPHVFEELFAVAGQSLHSDIDMVRLQTPFKYVFRDGSQLTVHDDAANTRDEFDSFCGAGDEWDAFMQRASRTWDIAQRTFFAGPMESRFELLRRMQSPVDLVGIDGVRTLASRSARAFSDSRLQYWANRYATYSGSSPWRAPATLACIAHIEQHYGSWHIRGGLSQLAEALARLAVSVGVEINTGAEVTGISNNGSSVTGLHIGSETVPADVVVCNADAQHLYTDLLPSRRELERATRAGKSSSGFALLLGLRGSTPGLEHHNVWFSADQRREFDDIFERQSAPDDPTIYVCCSSVTDTTQAPDGCENWFVLVNVAAGAAVDWDTYADMVIDRLGVRHRIVSSQSITPDDLQARYAAPGGAIYGSSSNGRRAAFLRAANRGPIGGLYLAGGSAHPGGGLPLVTMSAEIVANMIEHDR